MRPRRGVELTVRLEGACVSSRWFPLGRGIDVGDSHLFDVFCPLIDVGERPELPRLSEAGFLLRPVRGVHSVGAKIFSPAPGQKVRLILPAGVGGRVGEEPLPPADGPRTLEVALPFDGELHGAGGWSLAFAARESVGAGAWTRLPRPGWFALSLAYAFALLVGLLALGGLAPETFTWEELVPGTRHRMAMLQASPRKSPPRVEPDEPIAERLSNLRVAPRRQLRAAPRPRPQRQAQLRLSASRAPTRLTHTDHVVDLTDPDAPPADTPDDGPPELDGPGVTVPVVPVAPPPPPMVAPPPPMPPPAEPPPKAVKPPKRLSFPHVEYPESARHLGLEGKVRLLLHIDREGNVYKVEVVSGLHPILDRAAMAAARSARYEPALDGRGRPMASTATVTVRFELEEE